MTQQAPAIVWFRNDLRLTDHPALSAAAESGAPLLPVYIHDPDGAGDHAPGAASDWWLHHSLAALDGAIDGRLQLFEGSAEKIVPRLVKDTGACAVYRNRIYEPWRREEDARIDASMQAAGVDSRSFNGSLLFEPASVAKADGTPYRVFTPYYRKGCLGGPAPREPGPAPSQPQWFEGSDLEGATTLEELELLPDFDWTAGIEDEWTPGEDGAHARLERFLEEGLEGYAEHRDRPDRRNVSRLSPHLHFGELSPHQVWAELAPLEARKALSKDIDKFRAELGWREFSYYLLYHWPELPWKNFQPKFDDFPWRNNKKRLAAWQKGRTGYPFVDAGMRELWETGYMHNRVRMVVASFLVKNLNVPWQRGEEWFRDTLVDADLANNSAGWQWVAGSGADAAPFFRIFNPVTQGEKFDPDGVYIRRYVPELADLSDKHLHAPWEAPGEALEAAGIELGRDYPEPVVDLKESREAALAAFKDLSA